MACLLFHLKVFCLFVVLLSSNTGLQEFIKSYTTITAKVMQIWDYFMHALGFLESPCGSTHSLEEFTHLNKLHLPLYYTIVDNLEKEWCEMLGNPNAPGTSPQHQFVSRVRNQWMRNERNAVVGFLQSTQMLIDGADVGFCNRRRKNMIKEPQLNSKAYAKKWSTNLPIQKTTLESLYRCKLTMLDLIM